MGYFSNGTEGVEYHDRFCTRCKHDANEDCPVWAAHLAHNGSTSEPAREILDMLIPRSRDRLGNDRCALFVRQGARR